MMMNNEQDFILELQHLSKSYRQNFWQKKTIAVSDVGINFKRGHCTGLLGHNGAGKTTLIKMIFGLITPDKGTILYQHKPLSNKQKRFIGYMPETNKLPATLTPHELLNYHLTVFNPKLKGQKKQQLITQMLKEVRLLDHKNKRINRLSKGMGRRLAWAQAVIHQPNLVILDEPFSGLDPLGRMDMQRWIEELKTEKVSILLCTHELSVMELLCDDVYIMQKGKLVYANTPEFNNVVSLTNSLYKIETSGINESILAQLKRERSLADWHSLQFKGFLCNMLFDNYTIATEWLKTFLQKGIVVTYFGTIAADSNPKVLQLFEGGLN